MDGLIHEKEGSGGGGRRPRPPASAAASKPSRWVNWVNTALDETVAFDDAIQLAYSKVNLEETLIIVTADHGHTMSLAGYPDRGTDVRSYSTRKMDIDDGGDGRPFAILSYANGRGFSYHDMVNNDTYHVDRKDLSKENMTTDFYFVSPSSAPKDSETHSGADVGIFATGPFAHLFHGVHEQTFIYYVMAYSGCMDKYEEATHCKTIPSAAAATSTTSRTSLLIIAIVYCLLKA